MKKEMLKGLAMPEKKKDPMLELDEGLLEEDEAYDVAGEEGDFDRAGAAVADISDEELIAEMKKRGLSMDDAAEDEDLSADIDEEEFDGELA